MDRLPAEGRRALVTGASRGLGAVLALDLAREGWDTIAACGDPRRARQALEAAAGPSAAGRAAFGRITFVELDLASFASVRALATHLMTEARPLDLLVNNAGIAHGHGASGADGFELVMQTDFLSPFLLTRLLEPLLKRSVHPAVVDTVSAIHSVSSWKSVFARLSRDENARPRSKGVAGGALYYAAAKFALAAFSAEFASRGISWGLRCAAVHPGVIDTGIMYAGGWSDRIVKAIVAPFLVDTATGAGRLKRGVDFAAGWNEPVETAIRASRGSDIANFAYFKGDSTAALPRAIRDPKRASELTALAERLTGLTDPAIENY